MNHLDINIIKECLNLFIKTYENDMTYHFRVKVAKQTLDKLDKPVRSHNLMKLGGRWLGRMREWIQWNYPNGDMITWGSNYFKS